MGTELADRSGRASPAMVERLDVGFMSFVWVHANTMRSAGGQDFGRSSTLTPEPVGRVDAW